MTGTDNKKEKRAALSRVTPKNLAAAMVEPLRDTPGRTAIP